MTRRALSVFERRIEREDARMPAALRGVLSPEPASVWVVVDYRTGNQRGDVAGRLVQVDGNGWATVDLHVSHGVSPMRVRVPAGRIRQRLESLTDALRWISEHGEGFGGAFAPHGY